MRIGEIGVRHHGYIGLLAGIAMMLLNSLAAAVPAMPDHGYYRRPGGGGERVPFGSDPVALQIARGVFTPPTEEGGGWRPFGRGDDGAYDVPRGMYACFVVEAEASQVAMLEASGHGMVYVNGEPRAGDPYGYGYLHLPIRLNQGRNVLLFQHSRGPLRASLTEPDAKVFIRDEDMTVPDFLLGQDETLPVGLVVVNASEEPLEAVPWSSTGDIGEHARIDGSPVTVPPLSVRKVAFPVFYDGRPGETLSVTLGLDDLPEATRELELAIVPPGQRYRRTFLSRIDRSVQYYAVQPRIPDASAEVGRRYPIVLSLHGASVEAFAQARAYAPKTWCDIVAPTNRRPFGFDWEEWGRIDALEVLDEAMRHLDSDRDRVYLTGHSMGGHGVWSIGSQFPDRFAAVAPSAGWLSFATYTGGGHNRLQKQADGVAALFGRAANASDTSLVLSNLPGLGIYILHGDADDNVPVREARDIAGRLRALGLPFVYHEVPGAGHWWRGDNEPGAEVVDWPRIFDLFARTRRSNPAEVRTVDFVTVNPGVSARRDWVRIYQQIDPLKPSRVTLRLEPHRRRVVGTTENVAMMALDPSVLPPGASAEAATQPSRQALLDIPGAQTHQQFEQLELDGQPVVGAVQQLITADGREPPTFLHRDESGRWHFPWHECDYPPDQMLWRGKHPKRYGPFKHAFDNHVVFVYGTQGSPEQTAWAHAKARFDAEAFYYRGNGSVEVVADVKFDPQFERKPMPDRSVILYGNADTHEDWDVLLPDCPVDLRNGSVRIGELFQYDGEDRGMVFCYPRPGSTTSLVGVVGGTGLVGMQLTDRLPYFVSGVHYPDWTVFGPAVYQSGYASADAAGFFDNAWQLDPRNSATAAPARPSTAPTSEVEPE